MLFKEMKEEINKVRDIPNEFKKMHEDFKKMKREILNSILDILETRDEIVAFRKDLAGIIKGKTRREERRKLILDNIEKRKKKLQNFLELVLL